MTRVLNFFDSEFDDIVDEMGQYGVIKDMPEARADLVNILKEIDEVNGYDEVDENDSVIPQLEGNINWSKKGQQLIRPLKQKIEAEKERRRVAEEERRKAATQVAPATKQQTSAAASQSSAAADKLASQHYTKLRRKPRKKPPGSFDINLEKLRELQERRKTRRRRPESASQPSVPLPAVPVPAAPEPPSSAAAKPLPSAAAGESLPRGWSAHVSRKSGANYYYHNEYGNTYVHPSNLNQDLLVRYLDYYWNCNLIIKTPYKVFLK